VETARQIVEFVSERMRMSHIYQPLLIRALVRAGGSATLRQLAIALLMEDESQLVYYEDRIRKMPLPILRKHGIVTSDRNVVSLNAGNLSYEEGAAIELACTQKLAQFLQRRGLAIWDYRLIETDPVRTGIRYQAISTSSLMRRHSRSMCQTSTASTSRRSIMPMSSSNAGRTLPEKALLSLSISCERISSHSPAWASRPHRSICRSMPAPPLARLSWSGSTEMRA
jgi:hypothetical protein